MRNKNRRMKLVGLLLTGGMLMQFGGGGCLGGVFKQAGIGFGRSLGAIPGNIVGGFILTALNLGGDATPAAGN